MPGFVEVRERAGLNYLHIANPNGSFAECFLFGATLTKFVTRSGKDVLFTSSAAVYDGKTAIRGGVPVIFPQFGAWGNLPKHGFARSSTWNCVSHSFTSTTSSATLELKETEELLGLFPFPFLLVYTITVADEWLDCSLEVRNTGAAKDLVYDFAYHTYYTVSSLEEGSIHGLDGCPYKTAQGGQGGSVSGEYPLRETVDIIFEDCKKDLVLTDASKKVTIQSAMPMRLVWNCGPEGARSIVDMGDEDYKSYVCIEACAFHCGFGPRMETLHPGESRVYAQRITVE